MNHHSIISLHATLLYHCVSHTPLSMIMILEADCLLCETHTKAEERVYIIETKCSPWFTSWRWGNISASSM